MHALPHGDGGGKLILGRDEHLQASDVAREPHRSAALLRHAVGGGRACRSRCGLASCFRKNGAVDRAHRRSLGWRGRSPAMAQTPYDIGLDRNPANFQPLTPLTLLERAAAVFPDHTAIIHGARRFSYAEFYGRACRLGSAL